MDAFKQDFTSRADPRLLERMREAARQDGRDFQDVLEDVMRDYLEGRKQLGRPTVMAHYRSILAEYRLLAELLAQ